MAWIGIAAAVQLEGGLTRSKGIAVLVHLDKGQVPPGGPQVDGGPVLVRIAADGQDVVRQRCLPRLAAPSGDLGQGVVVRHRGRQQEPVLPCDPVHLDLGVLAGLAEHAGLDVVHRPAGAARLAASGHAGDGRGSGVRHGQPAHHQVILHHLAQVQRQPLHVHRQGDHDVVLHVAPVVGQLLPRLRVGDRESALRVKGKVPTRIVVGAAYIRR